jgi:hypothetical protein
MYTDTDPPQQEPAIDGPIVFTTSERYRGGLLGGVGGADAICAQHASAAGLAGEFEAWLSQVGSSVADRMTHSSKPYVLVDGTQVAGSWDDLLRKDLDHAIDRDEHGAALAHDGSESVWSATRIDGQAMPWTPGGTPTDNPRLDCTLWGSIDDGVGMLGSWSATGAAWTATSSGIPCSESARLYCFQQ